MCKQNPLKEFRTLEGAKRRAAIRKYLAQSVALDFAADPHALTFSQCGALHEMAKSVSWRKSISSPLSLGLAFFVYLARDAAPQVEQHSGKPAVTVTYRKRRSFNLSREVQA